MKILFATFSMLACIFFFMAGFSTKYQGFRLALILGIIFSYLAFLTR